MRESAEDYLETILILQKRNKTVRSVDIARAMSVTKASVSRAVGRLIDMGFIEMDDNNLILLTKEGKKQATAILDKHETITQFLMLTTDVSYEIAQEDACKMEHFVSRPVYNGIKKFIKQVKAYEQIPE